jgi:hypothetical protein
MTHHPAQEIAEPDPVNSAATQTRTVILAVGQVLADSRNAATHRAASLSCDLYTHIAMSLLVPVIRHLFCFFSQQLEITHAV